MFMEEIALESGALDRSAILTIGNLKLFDVLIAFCSAAEKDFVIWRTRASIPVPLAC